MSSPFEIHKIIIASLGFHLNVFFHIQFPSSAFTCAFNLAPSLYSHFIIVYDYSYHLIAPIWFGITRPGLMRGGCIHRLRPSLSSLHYSVVTYTYTVHVRNATLLTLRFDMCLNTNGLEMAIYKLREKKETKDLNHATQSKFQVFSYRNYSNMIL